MWVLWVLKMSLALWLPHPWDLWVTQLILRDPISDGLELATLVMRTEIGSCAEWSRWIVDDQIRRRVRDAHQADP